MLTFPWIKLTGFERNQKDKAKIRGKFGWTEEDLVVISMRDHRPIYGIRYLLEAIPTILKKEAETQVLVRDGDTTVIGGIYTKKTSDTFVGVPVLSKIPVLGWFFRNTKKNDGRTELVIFITPRIVNRLRSPVTQG